jgi:hypothetical protein
LAIVKDVHLVWHTLTKLFTIHSFRLEITSHIWIQSVSGRRVASLLNAYHPATLCAFYHPYPLHWYVHRQRLNVKSST